MAKKKTILIVDDEEDIRALLKQFLTKNNYNTMEAENSIQALELIEKKIPDLILSDLLLPKEHGLDFIKKIKEKLFIPVIIITGVYRKNEISDVIKNYFVEDFVAKPLDLNVLLQKINSILNA